ncbi:Hypothetical protein GLP15_1370 [Giardia lamblia P15]|uniref:Uncharacterized protein n=1 Tax=Giardia intestinalis (strain P15) TaxID=658858 RepID=E1EZB7_GIAIA|nr:Hypothetical protein GLP15_1370 [Giardia lamblia P15]
MGGFWQGVWRRHFYPHIVDMEDGVSRMSSLDFLRGVGILGMTLVHSLFNAVQLDYLLTFDHWYKYILAIFVGPILIFAPFRGVFAIISGTAYAFLTGQAMVSLRDSKKAFISWYFIGILKSVLSFFILWLLAIVYLYSIELWQVRIPNKQPVIYEPIWKVATVYASPLSYFSISSVIDSIIFPPIFLLFLVIFSKRFPSTTYSPIFKAPSIDDLHLSTSAPPSVSLKHKATTMSLTRFQPSAFTIEKLDATVPEQTDISVNDSEGRSTAPVTATIDPEASPGEQTARNSIDVPTAIAQPASAPVSTYSATGYIATSLTTAGVIFLLSYCIMIPTPYIVSALSRPLNLDPKQFCFLPDGFKVNALKSQSEYIKIYFLVSLGANYYPVFPYYCATMMGFVLGLCLLSAYYSKKEYNQHQISAFSKERQNVALLKPDAATTPAEGDEHTPHRSKRYSDFPTADPKFARIIYGVMCGFAGIMICSGLIGVGVKGTFFAGIDGGLDLSGYCMPREEGMAIFGIGMLLIIAFVALFEGSTVRNCCKHLQRASYILRFSTVSLTIFTCQIWIDLMGKFILSRYFPKILNKSEENVLVIILIIPMTVLTYWVFTTISDSIDNMWTLDWMISRIGGLVTGRYGKQRPLAEYHRRVRPMCLLARAPRKEADFDFVPIYKATNF